MLTLPDEISAALVTLHGPDGARVRVTPYGAHVLSWVDAAGEERLFLSPKAVYQAGAAIRGGVPVIFPQFGGLGSLPKHGFARNQPWRLVAASASQASFALNDTPATHALWPHAFLAAYTVRVLAGSLELCLSITNRGNTPFAFTAALHTYFCVDELNAAAVEGLNGLAYIDSAAGGVNARDNAPRVTFSDEVDRIYRGSPAQLRLVEPARSLQISASGFSDTVVWNPGSQKCALLADMQPEGFRQFVCVETAATLPVPLAPGATWSGAQLLVC